MKRVIAKTNVGLTYIGEFQVGDTFDTRRGRAVVIATEKILCQEAEKEKAQAESEMSG